MKRESALTAVQEFSVSGLVDSVRNYAEESVSANTRRAYGRQWGAFVAFCDLLGVPSLPASPEAVAAYLARLADEGKKVSTIEQAKAAVNMAHETAGHDSPARSSQVKTVMKGIRRALTVAPARKTAATCSVIRSLVAPLGDTMIDVRDRALVLLGFSGAFRRSELAALDVNDVEEAPEGLKIRVRKSKTDQEGEGMIKAIFFSPDIKTCPVRAFKTWIEASGVSEGPVFRSVTRGGAVKDQGIGGGDVARTIQKLQKRAGVPGDLSGHSLRAGFVTAAAKNGSPDREIMKQTGHKTPKMVNVYVREATVFEGNAAKGII